MASGHVTVPRKQAGHMAAPTSIALASIKPLPTGSCPHMAEAVEELRPEGVLNVRSYQKRTFSPASD